MRLDFRGIYKLEGDTLTVSLGELATSPTGFDDKKAFLHAVYKRVPDVKKPGN